MAHCGELAVGVSMGIHLFLALIQEVQFGFLVPL